MQSNVEPNPNFTLVILQPPADMTQQMKKAEQQQQSITKKMSSSPLDIREVDTNVTEDLSFKKAGQFESGVGESPAWLLSS